MLYHDPLAFSPVPDDMTSESGVKLFDSPPSCNRGFTPSHQQSPSYRGTSVDVPPLPLAPCLYRNHVFVFEWY